jgi:hypothetical protein
MKGANTSGIYGDKGIPAENNTPSERYNQVNWKDKNGNFWLFGGQTSEGIINDLWKYEPSSNNWTWVKGANISRQKGVYGLKLTPSNSTTPGGRDGAVSWVDAQGNLWLFGGNGYAGSIEGKLNDLWKYNVLTNQWTWIKGDSTVNVGSVYSQLGVYADNNKPGAKYNATSWVDKSGIFWLYGGEENGTGSADLWKYNPASNQWACVQVNSQNPGTSPGHRSSSIGWADKNGNLFLFGGKGYGLNYNYTLNEEEIIVGGLNDVWKYTTTTNQWTKLRGDNWIETDGTYGTLGVPSSTTTPGGRYGATGFADNLGKLWLYGGAGDEGEYSLNDLWKYDPLTNQWTWVKGDQNRFYWGNDGVYGTQGVASSTNKPGQRHGASGWVDSSGAFWMFGGALSWGSLNDLWKLFNPDKVYTYYKDADTDGYGNNTDSVFATAAPVGFAPVKGDCNDANASINPSATEICDGIDNNCDGKLDDGIRAPYYRDADGDGFGDPNITTLACFGAPPGYVSKNTDCDDNNNKIYPGAPEICNGKDNNCDGKIDGGGFKTFYRDGDGDGYGTLSTTTQACSAPSGYVSNSSDCNDASASVKPGATEIANGIDDDCDGFVDELAAPGNPVVKITRPTNGIYFSAPAVINMNASATDPDGSISKVEFYSGTTLLVTERYAPYTFSWQSVPVGTYKITAKAYDNVGKNTTSAVVQVVVGASALPQVGITAPASNSAFTAPATISISANATDADGTVSKVEFYNGTALLGSDLSAPYAYSWANVPSGNYKITAKAYDNSGMIATSTVVNIAVSVPNKAPVVKFTAPVNNSSYNAPATVGITASATDPDGTISKVEFYSGTTLLATERYAPFAFKWQNVAAGVYKLTAKAYDNKGKITTSAVIQVTVQASGAITSSVVRSKEAAGRMVDSDLPYLEQNMPNPSRGTTSISYLLPHNIKKAVLVVTDLKGSVIRQVVLGNGAGKGQVNVSTSNLAAGTYIYSLWKDGRKVASKRMIVTR